MADETTGQNDLAPHGAIIDFRWEIHQRLPDGKYSGHTTDQGRKVFDIKGDDRALAIEYINSLLDIIKRNATDVSQFELNEERLRQTRIQGTSQSREPYTPMFGMRGEFG